MVAIFIAIINKLIKEIMKINYKKIIKIILFMIIISAAGLIFYSYYEAFKINKMTQKLSTSEKKYAQMILYDINNKEHVFNLEIADSQEKKIIGLMHRTTLDKDSGMIFLHENGEDVFNMWMRNTFIPLDMVFINKDNIITKIVKNTKPLSLENISSDGKVKAVIEVNAGIADKIGLKEGDFINLKM